MISRVKSPEYKINSVTTSATSINKVANPDCIAKAINHHLKKKKKEIKGNQRGEGNFSISWAFSSFSFCLPQNTAFSLFAYNYVLKDHVERSKPVSDLLLADAEALVFHTNPV